MFSKIAAAQLPGVVKPVAYSCYVDQFTLRCSRPQNAGVALTIFALGSAAHGRYIAVAADEHAMASAMVPWIQFSADRRGSQS